MRGGDRVVQECNWMSGIRFDFHHSTYYCRNLSFRHPSSASLAGSEVPSSLAASPRGKPRGINHSHFTTNAPRYPGSIGSPNWRPLRWLGRMMGAYHSPTALPQLRRYRALITAQLLPGVIGTQVNHQGQRQQNQRNGKGHVNLALLTGVHIQCHGQCCRRSPQRLDKAVQL